MTICPVPVLDSFLLPPLSFIRGRICKRLRSPGIDSKESIPPAYVAWRASIRQIGLSYRPAQGWKSIPGLLKRFTNTGSEVRLLEPALFWVFCSFYNCVRGSEKVEKCCYFSFSFSVFFFVQNPRESFCTATQNHRETYFLCKKLIFLLRFQSVGAAAV